MNQWLRNHDCKVIYDDHEINFDDIPFTSKPYQSGVGKGMIYHYKNDELEFNTIEWIEDVSKNQYYEFHPISMPKVIEVDYPGSYICDEESKDCYTVINLNQGYLIPNTWNVDVNKIQFNGQFNSSAAYMPWFGQMKHNEGYIAIAITNDDMAYRIDHKALSHSTAIQMRTLASLGTMHASISRFTFTNGNYNDLCKIYKEYSKEIGLYKTLKEKKISLPAIDRLIQCSFVHKGIKKHIDENSDFYDHEHPENNDSITTFEYRKKEIEHFHELGADHLYLHIDGWGQPGYDNCHPDYIPVCKEAGGVDGLKDLITSLHQHEDLVGLHDQYRDYYFSAKSFDPYFALKQKNGKIFEMSRWAGGHQSYICASQAKYYVKRNFNYLFENGIYPDCSYLDVFTCNEMDECYHEDHLMNRKQCKEYRLQCLQYVSNKGIVVSSEEMNDWAMSALVFCHYAPYDFMLKDPSKPRLGIPVPLFNLVYHECVIIPWPMEEMKEDYMLYALINGGAPYLDRDGAYPNTDGAFDEKYNKEARHKIERCKIVSSFYQKVAYASIIEHIILNEYQQKTIFSNGISVIVDFKENTYQINE